MSLPIAVLAAEAHENLLPVSSVVFPIIAIVVFAALGIVTWSYHDVAHRHANRSERPDPHGH